MRKTPLLLKYRKVFVIFKGRKQVAGGVQTEHGQETKPNLEREEEREKKRENANQQRWLGPKDQVTSLTK